MEYLNYAGLTRYDSKIKNFINEKVDEKLDAPSTIVNGKVIRIDEYGNTVCGEAASPAEIAEATESWLDAHISGGSTIAVDSSLTVSGAAADAESAGKVAVIQNTQPTENYNRIWVKPEDVEYSIPSYAEHQELESRVDGLDENIDDIKDTLYGKAYSYEPEYTVVRGKYVNKASEYKSSATYSMTSDIPLKKGDVITFHTRTSDACALAKSLGDNFYTAIVYDAETTDEEADYSYTATEDMNVVLCEHRYYVINVEDTPALHSVVVHSRRDDSIEKTITELVDSALQEAKDSGEFNGPQGQKGDTGPQGPQGEKGDAGVPSQEMTQAAVDTWFVNHPDATTIVQDGTITRAKIEPSFLDKLEHTVYCSELGMTAEDVNGDNVLLLTNAINAGKTILVDNLYQLNLSSDPIAMTSDIRIFGTKQTNGFTVAHQGKLFGINGDISVYLKNITISSDYPYFSTIFYVNSSSYRIHNFVVEECIIHGNLKMNEFRGIINTNPLETNCGISYLGIRNNKMDNNTSFMFQFVDFPISSSEIIGNTIINLNNVFYYNAIENNNTYGDEIRACNKHCLVQNNFVKNDYDFWGDILAGNYYCFVLFEGTQINYIGNHVEGLHSESDCVVYDVYPSADNVFYHNNTSINNAQFAVEGTNPGTSLMKLKGIRKEGIFSNNIFKIEDDYADNVGKTGHEITSYIIDLPGNIHPKARFSNNYIYCQTGISTGFRKEFSSIDFSDNTIECKKWNGGPLFSFLHNSCESVSINNNKFHFEKLVPNKIGGGSSYYGFTLLYGGYATGSSENILKTCLLNNNSIIIDYVDTTNATNINALIGMIYPAVGNIDTLYFITKAISGSTDIIYPLIRRDDDESISKELNLKNIYISHSNAIPQYFEFNVAWSNNFSFEGDLINKKAMGSSNYIRQFNIPSLGDSKKSATIVGSIDVLTSANAEHYEFIITIYKDTNNIENYRLISNGNTVYDGPRTETQTDHILINSETIKLSIRMRASTATSSNQLFLRYVAMPEDSVVHEKIKRRYALV